MKRLAIVAVLAACGGTQQSEPAPAPVSNEASAPDVDAAPMMTEAELYAVLNEASRAYDRMEYAEAIGLAGQVLESDPDNIRALRVATSASCALGLGDRATAFAARLTGHDRRQMEVRCSRYGITL